MSIEQELLKHVKVKKTGDRQVYLTNMTKAVQGLEGDAWDGLSVAAQEWANTSAIAVRDKNELPDFPDAAANGASKPSKKAKAKGEDEDEPEDEEESDDVDEEVEEEGEPEEEDAKPAKKVTAKGKAKAPAKSKPEAKSKKIEAKSKDKPAKAAKAAKPDKKTRGGPEGMKVQIKKAIIKNPSISTEDLIALMKAGTESAPSKFTVSNIRAEFRHSLRVLAELELLNKEFDL